MNHHHSVSKNQMLIDGSTLNSDAIIIIIISDIIMGNSVKNGLCFMFSTNTFDYGCC